MGLTLQEAIQHHRKMWDRLARSGGVKPWSVVRLRLRNNCFLCEYVFNMQSEETLGLGPIALCTALCPLQWPFVSKVRAKEVVPDGRRCVYLAKNHAYIGLYARWEAAEIGSEKRKRLAAKIAALPQRGGA